MTDFATSSIITVTIITIIVIVISVSFRVMNTLINKLSKLCHICSKSVITGGGYSNAKTALATYLKIDVNEDKELSHWKILV